jgi:hypothetical protein
MAPWHIGLQLPTLLHRKRPNRILRARLVEPGHHLPPSHSIRLMHKLSQPMMGWRPLWVGVTSLCLDPHQQLRS